MTDNPAALRIAQDKAEKDYDATVTKLTRCQGQLASKADKANKLSPEEFRDWKSGKLLELAEIQSDMKALKKRRAEARRQFNSWEPARKEAWIDFPDCEGWWWNYTGNHFDIYCMCEDANGNLVISTGNNVADDYFQRLKHAPMWKFQEEPETP